MAAIFAAPAEATMPVQVPPQWWYEEIRLVVIVHAVLGNSIGGARWGVAESGAGIVVARRAPLRVHRSAATMFGDCLYFGWHR